MAKNLSELILIEDFNAEEEWIIISYSILLDDVLAYVYAKHKAGQIKRQHFDQYLQVILRWLINYYRRYEKAPGSTIQDIFNDKKKLLRSEKAEIIKAYLDRLADEYEDYDESGINPEYIKSTTIPNFIKRKEAERLVENVQKNIDENNIDDVEKSLADYTPVTDDEDFDPEIGTSTPGTTREVRKFFGEEKDKSAMFKLPGAIGDLIGPIYRGTLIAITGIEKGGKTHMVSDFGIHGTLHHKLKTLDINLEMSTANKNERFWQRLGGYAVDDDHAGLRISAIYDCENNQFGTCEVLKKKKNKKDLLNYEDDMVSFHERRRWRVCTKCRGEWQRTNAKRTKRFVPAIWYKEKLIRKISEKRVLRTVRKFLPYGISNYKIKCFPRFSVSFDDIRDYIMRYISLNNWHPDIIILDYPDVMAPVEGKLNDRFNVDYTWKSCARLAADLDCAVIVADQAVKAARGKRSITTLDTSESKTKDAHLDMRIAINVTELEYDLGLARIGMLFRRKGKLINSEVMTFRRLETCNTLLDSEWWHSFNTNYQTIINKE